MSRRDLARDPIVWLATGGTTIYIAAAVALLAAFGMETPTWRLTGVGIICLVAGLVLMRSQPPEIDTRANHAVIALPYIAAAGVFWGGADYGGIAIGAAMFIGPLASVRLQNRTHFFGHMAAATVILALAGATSGGDPSSIFGIVCCVLAIWVLGVSCWEILTSAEAQGDELERLVRRDPLTGVGNLRLLEESLPEELARHERAAKPLSILCLDLTGFKALNDQHGHAEGDALLRQVGGALQSVARSTDIVVRQGGDEFTMILSETSAEHAVRSANSVRAALAALPFEGITTGIGIATFPTDALDVRTLLHVGDERLRADKERLKVPFGPQRRAADGPAIEGKPVAPAVPILLERRRLGA